MSRSYLSKRQVQFERDSLDFQEEKHKNLLIHRDEVFKLWDPVTCPHDGPDCSSCENVRSLLTKQVEWSERDLARWRRKVERLEREQTIKRKIKRKVRRDRRAKRILGSND